MLQLYTLIYLCTARPSRIRNACACRQANRYSRLALYTGKKTSKTLSPRTQTNQAITAEARCVHEPLQVPAQFRAPLRPLASVRLSPSAAYQDPGAPGAWQYRVGPFLASGSVCP